MGLLCSTLLYLPLVLVSLYADVCCGLERVLLDPRSMEMSCFEAYLYSRCRFVHIADAAYLSPNEVTASTNPRSACSRI